MKKWKTMIFIVLIFFISTATISHGASNKLINVKINGKDVSVTEVPVIKDGQVVDMELPSFVYIDRTLVPVRLAEVLGAEVDWNQKTKTAIVSYNGKKIELTIDSDVAVVDGEKTGMDKNSIPRLVIFKNDDARTMVPLAFMSEMLGYDVGWDHDARSAFINTKKQEEPKEEIEEPMEEKEENIDYNKVTKISNEKIDGKDAIVIYNTKDIKYNMMKLKNPERIVVDVVDSVLEGSTFYEFKYEIGFIKGIRVSQFVPDNNYKPNDKVVRLVLDIQEGILNPNIDIKVDKDKIIVFPEENSWKNINYNTSGKNRTLTINNLEDTNYSVDYNSNNKSMEISIPKDAVDLLPGILSIRDGLVEDIKIIEKSNEIILNIQFIRGIEYNLLSSKIDNKVVLQIKRDSDIKNSDRIIVIDPGHGGIKPGSKSPNNIIEKDLNLTISLKLEKALRELDYNVIMTRDDDSHVELDDRAIIANNNFADIFISIHANSFTNPSAHGIEILYTPRTESTAKEKEQYDLAKFILDQVIKETGANNRGLVKSPNLVVTRKSKMPAVLVEVGFLSNPAEEKLIIDSSYQDKIIKGILKGIEDYFEHY